MADPSSALGVRTRTRREVRSRVPPHRDSTQWLVSSRIKRLYLTSQPPAQAQMGYAGYPGYYGGYGYGQTGVPGQPGQAASGGAAESSQQAGGWDQAAAAAYHQTQGWGGYYSESSLKVSSGTNNATSPTAAGWVAAEWDSGPLSGGVVHNVRRPGIEVSSIQTVKAWMFHVNFT